MGILSMLLPIITNFDSINYLHINKSIMPTPSSPGFDQTAMLFGGARYLSVDTAKLPNNNFTLSFRVRGGSGTAFFYGYPSFNSYQDTSISIFMEGGVRLRLGNVADGGEVFIPFASTAADQVHYIGLTFKENMGTGETLLGIFIDGKMTYKTFTLISAMDKKPMTIGGELYLATAPPRGQNQEDRIVESDLFSGTITEFNLWKALLTAEELVRDVKTSIPIREEVLCLSLPLDTAHYDYETEAFLDLSPNKINARNNVMLESTYQYTSGRSFGFPVLSRTFETWIRCGMDSWGKTLLSYADVSNSDHPNDGGDVWMISDPAGLTVNDRSTGVNVADGQWHHLAVVTEVTPGADEWSNTGKDSVYLDGVLKYTGTSNNVNQKPFKPLLIGAKNSQAADQAFQGALNQVKLWSVARTAAQILDSFQNGTPAAPGEASLVPLDSLNQSYRAPKIIELLPNGNLTASETPIISVTTDLMLNYKHAQVMGQQHSFQALQTAEGHALFFSIGTDNVFYVTIETPGHATGWNRIDLSSSIFQSGIDKALYQPQQFRVAQNATTGAINIALVVGGAAGDFVYTAWNLPNADATWNAQLPWQYRKFDAPVEGFSILQIKDVHVLESTHSEFLVVDINLPFSQNGSPYRRYFLGLTQQAGQIWQEHDLPLNFDSAIYSAIGKRAGETDEGIYTLGAVVDRYKLVYTPLNQPGAAVELMLPQPEGVALSSYAIAVAPISTGETNLFVAGNKQLFFFASDQQQNGSTGQAVDLPPTNVFMNVSKLRVHNGDGHVFVWGLNQQGRLFFTQCALGQELQKQAWSTPSVILTNALMAATYLNAANQNHVLFAYNSSNQLLQLAQDTQTSVWSQRSIVLPAVTHDDVIELHSYTSHVVVTDGSSLPKADVKVAITATSPVSVYVNDIYTILSPTLPFNLTTDPTGNLTIIQETESLTAVCYQFVIEGIDPLLVNPMAGVLDTIKNIQTGDDLMKVRVTDDQNKVIPLIDPDKAKGGTPDALAKVMQQLTDTLKYVPVDGSKHKGTGGGVRTRSAVADSNRQVLWGLNFEQGGMTYYEGAAAVAQFRSASFGNTATARDAESVAREIIDDIWSFFNWVKDEVSSLFDAIEHFVVEVVEGIVSFVFKIAGKIFVFLIDSLVAAVSAFMSFLDWVGVDTKKLRKWLGYVFDWDDILLTHRVFKHFFSNLIDYGINAVESYEDDLLDLMSRAEDYIKNWAGIGDRLPDGFANDSAKNITAGINPVRGQNTPAFNMVHYHLKNNAAGSGFAKDLLAPVISGDLGDKMKAILAAAELLKEKFDDLMNSSDPEFYKTFANLSFKEIIVKILGFVGIELLEIAKTILTELFKLFNAFLEGIKEVLTSTIEIPVLSYIYKTQLTKGDDLSILDVACLVAAVPVTVVFKIATGANMFAAGPETDKFLNAKDFSVFQAAFAKPANISARSATTDPNAPIVHTVYEKWVLASGIMALVGGLGISVLTALSKPWAEEEEAVLPSDPITALNGVLYLPYVLPDVIALLGGDKSEMEWWEKLNAFFVFPGILKAMIDVKCAFKDTKFLESDANKLKRTWGTYISPCADLVINGLWLIPVGASICSPKNTTPAFKENIAGGFFFDFSGMLSPVIAFVKNPYVLAGALIANTAFNIIYGSVTVAAADRVFNRRD